MKKGTITFVSDDLLHDHQQVKRMQKRAVSIVSEKTGITFTKFVQFSDSCGAQYKSCYCTADFCTCSERILGSKDLEAAFHYFESNEGKFESDTAGSIFKI